MSNMDRESQSLATSQQTKKTGDMPPPPKKPGMSPKLIAVAGGVVAVAVMAGVLFSGTGETAGTPDRPTLSLVKKGDVDQAAGTLAPDSKTQLVDDAKACKMPLAIVQLTKADTGNNSGTNGTNSGGMIRIRAGSYVSPAFTIGDAPVNVAVPFPAPYATGKGEISIEGTAGVVAQLSPGIRYDPTGGTRTIPVWWKTDKPCGA